MDRDDLCFDSTVSLARRIGGREVSPLDAVHAYLERIDPLVHVSGERGRRGQPLD